jgi:hypothetical protein
MAHEFEIRREIELPVTPEQVWAGITAGTAGWLWPIEYEPGVGGKPSEFGAVTAWDPPRHLAVRAEGENWFNSLDHVIEGREGGGAVLRYVHSGILVDDWENQYDAANKHTDFYLHTLGQYVQYFGGCRATYAAVEGPAASTGPDAFGQLRGGLGLTDGVAQGDAVRLDLPGLDPLDGVVDYLSPHFIGVRTAHGLYRFFGRNAWGMPVGLTLHLFSDGVDREKTEKAWSAWLNGVFA